MSGNTLAFCVRGATNLRCRSCTRLKSCNTAFYLINALLYLINIRLYLRGIPGNRLNPPPE